jgi:cytochrome c-type biogenesis protein CcmH/NrfF
MMPRPARALALAILVLLVILAPAGGRPTSASAAEPRASLPDIEDEVMCPICGTLLELSQSPQAQRERVFIRTLIARGESKQQIKDALVAEYGQEVLALPGDSGFDLAAYVVPILGFLAAAVALVLGVRRWRRAGRERPPPPDRSEPAEDAERLDADIARYDL